MLGIENSTRESIYWSNKVNTGSVNNTNATNIGLR